MLVERYRAALIHFLYRMVQEGALAEELAVEVFRRLYRSIASFDPVVQSEAELFRIATDLALAKLRNGRIQPPEQVVHAVADASRALASIPGRSAPHCSCTNIDRWTMGGSPRCSIARSVPQDRCCCPLMRLYGRGWLQLGHRRPDVGQVDNLRRVDNPPLPAPVVISSHRRSILARRLHVASGLEMGLGSAQLSYCLEVPAAACEILSRRQSPAARPPSPATPCNAIWRIPVRVDCKTVV